jgi:hypothetical protein
MAVILLITTVKVINRNSSKLTVSRKIPTVKSNPKEPEAVTARGRKVLMQGENKPCGRLYAFVKKLQTWTF